MSTSWSCSFGACGRQVIAVGFSIMTVARSRFFADTSAVTTGANGEGGIRGSRADASPVERCSEFLVGGGVLEVTVDVAHAHRARRSNTSFFTSSPHVRSAARMASRS